MRSVLEYRDRRFDLVIVDVQRKFIADNEGPRDSVTRRIGRINDAVSLFREAGRPIVYVCFDGSRDGSACPEEDMLVDGLLPPRDWSPTNASWPYTSEPSTTASARTSWRAASRPPRRRTWRWSRGCSRPSASRSSGRTRRSLWAVQMLSIETVFNWTIHPNTLNYYTKSSGGLYVQ